MVVAALGNMRDPRAVEILLELLADDAVSGYAAMGLGKLRAAVARPFILPLLEHPERWVRQEAAKALKRIDTARRTTPS
jgi:HEAT repeat protein